MDVELNDMGAFDVRIGGLTEEEALKAIATSSSPKVKAALQSALDAARDNHARGGSFSFVVKERGGKRVVDVSHDGTIVATIHRYKRPGRDTHFYQTYVKCVGESIRRAEMDDMRQAIIDAVLKHEGALTTIKPTRAIAEDLL